MHRNGIRHTGLLTACEQDQDGTDENGETVDYAEETNFVVNTNVV
jgi:hypothetical protein